MKYQKYKDSVKEICSEEEIDKFSKLMQKLETKHVRALMPLSAKEFMEFYTYVSIIGAVERKRMAKLKLENNIRSEKEVPVELKEEFDKINSLAKSHTIAQKRIEDYSRTLGIANLAIKGKSVMRCSQELRAMALKESRNEADLIKMDDIIIYIEQTDAYLRKMEELGGEE